MAGVGVGAGPWAAPICLQAASGSWVPSAAPRRWLLEVLPARDKTYDPLAKMLVVPANTVAGYPWNVRSPDVHGLRPSLAYLAALLDTGVSWRLERAREILRAVVALQDQDPQSQTYGQWPWALEVPLSQAAPRDPQDCDVASAILLGLWRQYRGLLGSELEGRVQTALLHTARAAAQHRAAIRHTRAALMECGFLLVAARELNQGDLRADARDRRSPRVGARSSRQPWALGWNAVGVFAAVASLPKNHWLLARAGVRRPNRPEHAKRLLPVRRA